LKAIFMDDFTEVEEKKTAWNVRWAISWYVIVMFNWSDWRFLGFCCQKHWIHYTFNSKWGRIWSGTY
jgi:hypothetical protein